MHSKVRMSAALAVALALAAGTAQALPRPTHPPHPAATSAGLVDAARAWLASWFPGAASGQLSAVRGREGSNIDPNGSPRSIGTLPMPGTVPPTSLPTL